MSKAGSIFRVERSPCLLRWLSDRLQRRKPIALVGYILAAVAKPLIGLSSNLRVCFASRSVDRLGAGTRSAPRDVHVAASVDQTHNLGNPRRIRGRFDRSRRPRLDSVKTYGNPVRWFECQNTYGFPGLARELMCANDGQTRYIKFDKVF